MRFDEHPGGVFPVGARGPFCFDKELPRHTVLLQPFALADRLVTNAEFLAFIDDGGYGTPALWLSDGWSAWRANGWRCPLYWRCRDGQWLEYRLSGERALVPDDPAVHVSAYELDAARQFLRNVAESLGAGAHLLIGVDRKKDKAVLEAAYNDTAGVTSQFNLNVLRHLNDALTTDFDLNAFRHLASYNEQAGCIQMFLESLKEQTAQRNGIVIRLARGETVHTENSYKYAWANSRASPPPAGSPAAHPGRTRTTTSR